MDDHNISPATINLIIGLVALMFAPVLWMVGVVVVAGPHCADCTPSCRVAGMTAESVSHYYCWSEVTRNLFVGALTGLGLQFLAYRGWARTPGRLDRLIAVWCAMLAFGIASFPTSSLAPWVQVTHRICAASLFISLSWIARCRFSDRWGDPAEAGNPAWKQTRNGIYGCCAALMLLGMLFIGMNALLEALGHDPKIVHYKFHGEALALIAFGSAWLVKSRFILGYADAPGHVLAYRPGWENLPVFRLFRAFDGPCLICGLRRPLARLLGASPASPGPGSGD